MVRGFRQSVTAGCVLLALSCTGQEIPEFVGVERCMQCHAKPKIGGLQFYKWAKGPHARAFKSLESPRGREIAAAAGIAEPTRDALCLSCHTTAPAHISPTQGVNCERCHGPGSKYAFLNVMRNPPAAHRNGLRVLEGLAADGAAPRAAALCLECHGVGQRDKFPAPEAHPFAPFDYQTAWEAIDHSRQTLAREAEP